MKVSPEIKDAIARAADAVHRENNTHPLLGLAVKWLVTEIMDKLANMAEPIPAPKKP